MQPNQCHSQNRATKRTAETLMPERLMTLRSQVSPSHPFHRPQTSNVCTTNRLIVTHHKKSETLAVIISSRVTYLSPNVNPTALCFWYLLRRLVPLRLSVQAFLALAPDKFHIAAA